LRAYAQIFGHLHLVLRDLADAEGVEEHVFGMEQERRNSVDALLQRNRIRYCRAQGSPDPHIRPKQHALTPSYP
jgi:hypothetical protein